MKKRPFSFWISQSSPLKIGARTAWLATASLTIRQIELFTCNLQAIFCLKTKPNCIKYNPRGTVMKWQNIAECIWVMLKIMKQAKNRPLMVIYLLLLCFKYVEKKWSAKCVFDFDFFYQFVTLSGHFFLTWPTFL